MLLWLMNMGFAGGGWPGWTEVSDPTAETWTAVPDSTTEIWVPVPDPTGETWTAV